MVKTLRISIIALLAMVCNSVMADEVKFDFDNDYATLFPTLKGVSSSNSNDGDFTEATTATVEGFTVTVSAAEEGNKTANRIWSGTPRLRMYSGTLTISAPAGKTIKSIIINQGKWNAGNTANVGNLNHDKKTWEGDAQEIVITVAGNTQIKSLVVSTGAQEVVDITNTPETAYTVAKAHELITADKGLDASVYVKGIITGIKEVSLEHGNATYYINDTNSEEGALTVFRGYFMKDAEGNDKFTSEDQIKVGDNVVIYGKLINYNGTYEFAQGNYIYSLNGQTSGIGAITADGGNKVIYNLNGQRLQKMQKGINIVNGKKVIVK